MSYAVERDWRDDNPVAGFKGRLQEGPGHRPCTMDEVATFFDSSSPPLHRAAMLALYTGQRQGDVLRMLWSQYDGAAIEVVQNKTGERLWIPVHYDLKAMLDSMPKTAAVILTTTTGRPWSQTTFKKGFRLAIQKAGLKGIVFHGLRHTAAAMLADAGCTDAEIMDITGHRTRAMVTRYTRNSERKARAASAIRKLENRTKVPNIADRSA